MRTRRPRSRLAGPLATALGALALLAGPALPTVVGAQTAPAPGSFEDLQQKYDQAKAAADAATARYSAAEAKLAVIEDALTALRAQIGGEVLQSIALRAQVQQRAVEAYKTHGGEGSDVIDSLLSGASALDSSRKAVLLDRVNAVDNRALDDLRALDEDLALRRKDVEDQKVAQVKITAQMRDEKAVLDKVLADAKRAFDELQARYAREAAARAAAERARIAAEQAAARRAAGGGGPVNPGGGGFTCPLPGSSFSNSYGDPRSGGRVHLGIDMVAPFGTPELAVKAGTISFQSGGAGGNMVYFVGNDGFTYFYAHLSSYAGGPRSVSAGEVIGYVGQTGDASIPHLHFEIRTPDGTINPYPTLVAYC